jgi:hypothetical protein
MAKRVIGTRKPDLNTPVNMQRLGQFVRFRRTSMGMTIENAAGICVALWFNQNLSNGKTDENDEWL